MKIHDGSFITLLRACGKKEDLLAGNRVHAQLLRQGLLEKSSCIANALVSMYAKCGSLVKARALIDGIPAHNVVAWTAVITAYARQGHAMEALSCYEKMQDERLCPDAMTFASILKVCGSLGVVDKGEKIHDEISRSGFLENDIVLANALVDMYAKCGNLIKAQQVLEDLTFRDVVSWNALVAGYAQYGQEEEAFRCLERMKCEGIYPDVATFSCILKVCGSIEKGRQIHDEIAREGLLGNNRVVLGNALVVMYAKGGALAEAWQVFEDLPVHKLVAWNALIAGYAQQGQAEEALNCFELMRSRGFSPDAATFAHVLKATGGISAVDKGEDIHDEIVRRGLLVDNTVLGNALVDMYAKCGVLTKARQVLEELPSRDAILWSVLIAGYTEKGRAQEALDCLEHMKLEGLHPDTGTFACILSACGSMGAVDKGEQVHDEIVSRGMLGTDMVLATGLVDMYAKCGALEKAQKVLEGSCDPYIPCWNALIAAYCNEGQGAKALCCFEQMKHKGLTPDALTFACILRACGSIGAAFKGEQVHDEISRQGMLVNDIVLGTALVDMYARCGALATAARVLEELPGLDVASWNALIGGYTQQGRGEDALECFEQMQGKSFEPDAATFTSILKACGCIGAADKGEEIHDEIAKQGLLGHNLVLGNALVDMYAKCGCLAKARGVLEELSLRDVVSWTAMIAGYAQQGHGRGALDCFVRMQQEGLSPNAITYTRVIHAYDHSVDDHTRSEGRVVCGTELDVKQYTCMVHLLGRSGHFQWAAAETEKWPLSYCFVG